MMENKLLLEKLKQLKEVDNALSFDNQNPDIYRKRALVFQELGCDSLAQYDNRICAYLENRIDIEHYNRNYQAVISKDYFAKIYQSESHTHYYEVFFDILQNDNALLKEKIDPIHFALRSGNATLLGLFNLALRDCNDAMRYLTDFKEEHAIATLNKALLLLLTGDYENGWKLYESRWETNYKTFKNPIILPKPKWQGESLNAESRLLIHSEQGIGDNIQFVRYAIYLKQQGVNVLVWNNEHINDFLTANLAEYGIPTAKFGDIVQFTHWVSMMSLPHLCQTTLENIPLTAKYLKALSGYLQKWKEKLPLVPNKMKIGIVWRGGSKTDTDKIRSIPFSLFSQLFSLNAEFYVLQKEVRSEEAEKLKCYANVHDLHAELESFSDTSAIIEQMDLVICVDTSVAHLAAAMGKPTWILINYKPDFRWLLNRENSIWYDSVQLFRQEIDYDWNKVIWQVHTYLKECLC
ncbi:glycosyltransferase family 9 protein [Bibersteinia trehalosi]|uniref:glycosyltransferase family 9 protein n=1 Tax=Bibersteinia trehalosi TaxID=47735 RepID=UPI002D775E4F|nr:glycosyltransferase family 9 protein [Bibersteinia trehalosi]